MNIKGGAGSIGGVKVKGGYVDLDEADASSIINATSGLIKTGVSAGLKVGVAVGVLALLLRGLKVSSSPSIPITSLSKIKTYSKEVFGICIAEDTMWMCENEDITIPTYLINNVHPLFRSGLLSEKMFTPDFLNTYIVSCIDGSHYTCKPITRELTFVTICGVQKVKLYLKGAEEKKTWYGGKKYVDKWLPEEPGLTDVYAKIRGASVGDVESLRGHLQFAMENNLDSIIDTIGQPTFEKFFKLN